jgi:hypothetical protein
VAEVIEKLPSKCEALSPNPRPNPNQKINNKTKPKNLIGKFFFPTRTKEKKPKPQTTQKKIKCRLTT